MRHALVQGTFIGLFEHRCYSPRKTSRPRGAREASSANRLRGLPNAPSPAGVSAFRSDSQLGSKSSMGGLRRSFKQSHTK